MKNSAVCRLTSLFALAAFSQSIAAHPGHSPTEGVLAGLLHMLADWPLPLALLLLVIAAIWRRPSHDARRRTRP